MDEFAHILVESLGLIGSMRSKIAVEVSKTISESLTIRTSTVKADVIPASRRCVRIDEDDAIRMRTRFAMRFGDQDAEDSSEPTRADHGTIYLPLFQQSTIVKKKFLQTAGATFR